MHFKPCSVKKNRSVCAGLGLAGVFLSSWTLCQLCFVSVSEVLPLAGDIKLLWHGIWVRSSALWHIVAGLFFSPRIESYFHGQTGCWEELFVLLTKEDGHRGGGSTVLRVWGGLEGWEALRGCCWGSSGEGGGSRGTGQLQVWLPLSLSYPWL